MEHGIDLGEPRIERFGIVERYGLIFEPVLRGYGFESRFVAPGEQWVEALCLGRPRHELSCITRRSIDHEPAGHCRLAFLA